MTAGILYAEPTVACCRDKPQRHQGRCREIVIMPDGQVGRYAQRNGSWDSMIVVMHPCRNPSGIRNLFGGNGLMYPACRHFTFSLDLSLFAVMNYIYVM